MRRRREKEWGGNTEGAPRGEEAHDSIVPLLSRLRTANSGCFKAHDAHNGTTYSGSQSTIQHDGNTCRGIGQRVQVVKGVHIHNSGCSCRKTNHKDASAQFQHNSRRDMIESQNKTKKGGTISASRAHTCVDPFLHIAVFTNSRLNSLVSTTIYRKNL